MIWSTESLSLHQHTALSDQVLWLVSHEHSWSNLAEYYHVNMFFSHWYGYSTIQYVIKSNCSHSRQAEVDASTLPLIHIPLLLKSPTCLLTIRIEVFVWTLSPKITLWRDLPLWLLFFILGRVKQWVTTYKKKLLCARLKLLCYFGRWHLNTTFLMLLYCDFNSPLFLFPSHKGAAFASNMDTAESCGIVGVVGGDDAVGFLLEGLTILRNRGYDSAGVASVGTSVDGTNSTQLVVTKYASRDSTCDSIDLVRAHSSKHVGELHLSWV